MSIPVLKVLILEDNPYDAELNLKTLHKESWVIDSRIASDEDSFTGYLIDFDPDVILSDYNLPQFNGMDALRISKIEKPLTPFIIVTGSLDEETAVDCIKQGAWDYVLKERLIRLNPAVKFAMELRVERQQRELTEASFRESEEHYRALAQNSPDIIMRFDRNLRHLFVNDAVNSQLKLKPELFIGKSHHEMGIFNSEMCDFWEASIARVFESQKPHEVEFSIPFDNKVLYFEWRLFPEFDPYGEVTTVLAVARDISFKKQAQDELLKSQERLDMALEATSDGIWDYDLRTNEIYFSPRYAIMLGYSPDEFKNDISVFNELMHPDDKERVLEYMNESRKNHQNSVELVTRLRKQDGTYAWIHARGKVFSQDSNNEPIRIVGTNVDITEQKRQDEIQKTIFDIGNAVVATRNLDELYEKIQEILGRIIDTKNCYIALYDKKTDRITLPFHRDEKDKFKGFPAGKTITAYVIRSGKAQLLNLEIIDKLSKAGEIEAVGTPSVSWLGVPLKIDNNIIGVFTVQSYDEAVKFSEEDVKILEFVSDQIALAISRKKDEDYIRLSEQKLREIIESSPDGLLVTDSDGHIMDQNTSIVEILQGRNNTLMRRNFLDFIYPEDTVKVEELFRETIETRYQKNHEIRMVRDDNSEFFAEISLGLIQNYKKSSETFIIIIKDITTRINYESNLRIAKERAEESDKLKTSFLSNMSHEIRTPLNAIVGFAELLAQNNLEDVDKKEFISHINFGSDTLLNLIDDIIDISKIEAGQIRINNSLFKLSSLFSELQTLFLKNLKRQNREQLFLSIENNGFNSDINIIADSFRLKQVFINLLNNSIKFTENGGVSFGIKEVNGDFISFFVKDTGIGIKEDKKYLIFDRFRQGHESKTKFYGGTGLGLAISKNLVELMGGEISVYSEPGIGSEFVFSINYVESDADVPQPQYYVLQETPDWRGKTILIAEDEASNFILLQDILSETNVDIIWAKNGGEAVRLFKDHPEIDLILMDIRLPIINGYEATAKIREIRKNVPIIAQTAYAMSGEREKSISAGCDDYLSKPIKSKLLMAMLSKYLNK